MPHLKWKTLALIFVATGRRASGIANLSRDSFKWGDDGFLYLKWVKKFRPKNFLLVERANVKRRAKGLPVPPNCPSIFLCRSLKMGCPFRIPLRYNKYADCLEIVNVPNKLCQEHMHSQPIPDKGWYL